MSKASTIDHVPREKSSKLVINPSNKEECPCFRATNFHSIPLCWQSGPRPPCAVSGKNLKAGGAASDSHVSATPRFVGCSRPVGGPRYAPCASRIQPTIGLAGPVPGKRQAISHLRPAWWPGHHGLAWATSGPGSFIWRFPMADLEFCLGFGQDDKLAGCCFPDLGHGLGRGDASKRSGQDTADGTAQGTLRSSVFVGSGSSRHITKASIVNASCQPVPGK